MNRPLLSVCLITYNHVNYIQQAIEGVLMQKVSFDYELIIADDCSSDGTTEIVKKYAAAHPGLIRAIFQKKNVGAAENYVTLLQAAAAKYVAYLEGDDYWTEVTKLEKQVRFLETSSSYSLCFHDVYSLINGRRKKIKIPEIKDTSDINYLLSHRGYINSLSIVYRNSQHIVDMVKKLINCPFGDFITYVAIAQKGLIKHLPEYMGVYRIHSLGTWSTLGLKKIFENTLIAYKMLFAHLPPEQKDMLKIKYLIALEDYFSQDEFIYTDTELDKLLIAEMNIEPYVLHYLKSASEERKKALYYSNRVSYKILLKSLQYKMVNKL